MRIMKKVLLAFSITACLTLLAGVARAQAPAAGGPSVTADTAITGVSTPKPEDKAAGDPAGAITGTAADVPLADAKKGLTVGDLASMLGQNLVATNFVWTLITGFLVMFMQAGFAIVETGLGRRRTRTTP